MKTIVSILTLMAKLQLVKGAILCPDTFTLTADETHAIGSTCYYCFLPTLQYTAAKSLCESGGAHLLFLETNSEVDDLSFEVSGSFDQVWIGAQRISGVWKWINGAVETTITQTEFSSAPTNDYAITDNLLSDYGWIDATAPETHMVICEKIGTVPVVQNSVQGYYMGRDTPSNERDLLSVTEARSAIECAASCTRLTGCFSMIFNTDDNRCKLFALVPPSASNDGCIAAIGVSCWDKV